MRSHAHEVDRDNPIGPYHRVRCVCCGWPTLLWPETLLLDEQLDTDDGITLEQAQENVRRNAWMYDPAEPPEWMTLTPNDAKLMARRHLANLFEQIDARSRRESAADELWKEAKATEDDIRDLARRREHDAEAIASQQFDPDDDE